MLSVPAGPALKQAASLFIPILPSLDVCLSLSACPVLHPLPLTFFLSSTASHSASQSPFPSLPEFLFLPPFSVFHKLIFSLFFLIYSSFLSFPVALLLSLYPSLFASFTLYLSVALSISSTCSLSPFFLCFFSSPSFPLLLFFYHAPSPSPSLPLTPPSLSPSIFCTSSTFPSHLAMHSSRFIPPIITVNNHRNQ